MFFFVEPLTLPQKSIFERDIVGFFSRLLVKYAALIDAPAILDVRYDDSQCVAEFLTHLPWGDEAWYGTYLAELKRFSQEFATIVSFQGRLFKA